MEPTTSAAGGTGVFSHNTAPPAVMEPDTVAPPAPILPPNDPAGAESLYGQAPGSQPQTPPPPPPAPPMPPRPRRQRAAPTPAPAIVQQVTPAANQRGIVDDFAALRRPPRRRRRNLQYIIEHRLETPVFFIVAFMMIIRAAEIYSGGRLIISQVLGSYYPIFEIISGFGLAVGSEMLMTIAGRSWRSWQAEAADTQARPGMSKIARVAYVNKAKQSARYSQGAMMVGGFASILAGIAFLITNSGTSANVHDGGWWWSIFIDLVITSVITVTVFYLGVLRESHTMSDAEEALEELREAMNEATKAAIRRFHLGVQTEVDEKLIAESLPHDLKAKFTRAVAKKNIHKTWTSRELRNRLGIGNDATAIRKLNRAINLLSKNPDNGLTKAPDGKTWLIPLAVVRDEWDEEIAAKDAERLLATKQVA